MWIVRLALRRPYTFVVGAVLLLIAGVLAIVSMPKDVFPNIDIPVVSVIWTYNGMSPDEMEKRIVNVCERAMTTTVNDIEHLESQSYNGYTVIRVYFQPTVQIASAVAQVTAINQTILKVMPPGITPPLVVQYNAASVPVLQASMQSETLSEQELYDLGLNNIRQGLATVQGAAVPLPYGGRTAEVEVDLDPVRMYGWNISPADISNALNQQNLILPAGTVKIGQIEYNVRLNSSPLLEEQLNDLPIKTVNGATVFMRDVAQIHQGFSPQTSMVHANGKRSALLTVLKNGAASTLDIVQRVRDRLPQIQATLPASLTLKPLFDQSIFVRASLFGVLREAGIAAFLTAMMILLFLGSWRSTLVVTVSIPLSILVSIVVMWALGQTLNIMTLGGLALAVGILVDDATVEIENIHRNLGMKKPLVHAILDGAAQIAVPAFVSTLSICIVFVPVVFISGVAKYLFIPLAMAVVFAMLASYLLSRTLIPTMTRFLLYNEVERYGGVHSESELEETRQKEEIETREGEDAQRRLGRATDRMARWSATHPLIVGAVLLTLVALLAVFDTLQPHSGDFLARIHLAPVGWLVGNLASHWYLLAFLLDGALIFVVACYLVVRYDWIWKLHERFEHGFDRLRGAYESALAWTMIHRLAFLLSFSGFVVASLILFFFIGQDFFPTVDAGQIDLHVRCPAGTRIEETERYFLAVEDIIKQTIPPEQVDIVLDNIGIPNGGVNLAFSSSATIGANDGEILVSLNQNHSPTGNFVARLRKTLPRKFPELVFFFQPADITSEILNFGLAAPIDIQIRGTPQTLPPNWKLAEQLRKEVAAIPGAVDVHLQQVLDVPELHVNVDRTLASQVGLTQQAVAQNVLISLSGSVQTAPNYWVNPKSGINYQVGVQTPQYEISDLSDLVNTPITGGSFTQPELLRNLANVGRGLGPEIVDHYNIQPVYDVYASVQGTDLGAVAKQIDQTIARVQQANKSWIPKSTQVVLLGQVQSMRSSFSGLALGLIFAVVLVYLLMVINFQSWIDPLIILMALPGALSGILWALFITGTSLSTPSLMGAIMCIGVATSNSILMITFANDQRQTGLSAHDAALLAGGTRLRPVIMTALAMIIGMFPMALGMGEGGEQNAPLGRAVIGGLSVATFATLFFVPLTYSVLRKRESVGELDPLLKEKA